MRIEGSKGRDDSASCSWRRRFDSRAWMGRAVLSGKIVAGLSYLQLDTLNTVSPQRS